MLQKSLCGGDAHATLFLHDHESECLPLNVIPHAPTCIALVWDPPANQGRAMARRQLGSLHVDWGSGHREWREVSLVDSSIRGWPGCEMGWSRTFPRPSQGSPFWEKCREIPHFT